MPFDGKDNDLDVGSHGLDGSIKTSLLHDLWVILGQFRVFASFFLTVKTILNAIQHFTGLVYQYIRAYGKKVEFSR